ncbi:hypothetical protein [Salaquimonas pukyongi]|uniref:hypothetical protein n=1 Tax=Salaquimonas pukyongi TaxID=2712698 RepID=UPI0012EC034D|nr:hypothetical protein [Salaquimonas pukyongi]
MDAHSVSHDTPERPDALHEQPFSHLQWYLHHAENTVYLAAESDDVLSERNLHEIAGWFMTLAPQLNYRANGRGDRHLPVPVKPEAICHHEEVGDLHQALAWAIENHKEIYTDSDRPNFRAYGFRLRRARKDSARSLYVCCSSHALMEGSESARIMRMRNTVHHAERSPARLGLLKTAMITLAGLILAPLHLIASWFDRRDVSHGNWAIIDISRKSIKQLAKRHGVRQRSVLFSLPLYGLHFEKSLPHQTTKKAQLISYSTLPDSKTTLEDAALNLRMQVGRIPSAESFEAHLKAIDQVLGKEDTTEIYSQAFYNSILGVHRVLHRLFPFLYRGRFFTYVPYDFVLSLLPPHLTGGWFRKLFRRSIFCGSYTPGANSCVFVPYLGGFSLNFHADPKIHANMDAFTQFLKQQGIDCRRVL